MKISEMHKNRIPGSVVETFCVLTRDGRWLEMLDLTPRARGWRGVEREAWQMLGGAGDEFAVMVLFV